ncbi:MAG: hypothetical protein PHO55_12310, partial [Thiomonas arsenitoxydans]|nr:hypothetical protein [Thiomonas arsenitoxydans]
SGGSNLATALSLNACPYRAMSVLHRRPLGLIYGDDNYSAAGGSARTKFLRSLRRLSATQEIEIVAPALVKSLLLLPPPTPGGRSLPSPTLTPRLLAQRPFIRPRARVGALF